MITIIVIALAAFSAGVLVCALVKPNREADAFAAGYFKGLADANSGSPEVQALRKLADHLRETRLTGKGGQG